MRQYLLTNFYCSVCGNGLGIVYEKDIKHDRIARCHPSEPTGADVVHQDTYLEPCKNCMRPTEDIKRHIKAIMDITQ